MGAVQALCRLLCGVGVDGMELARVTTRWLNSPFLSFLIGTDVYLCSLFSPVAWTLRGWVLCSSYFMWLHGMLFRWICPLCMILTRWLFLNIFSVIPLDAGTCLLQLFLEDPLDLEWFSMSSLILASGMLLRVPVSSFNDSICYSLPLLGALFCKSPLVLIKMPLTQLLISSLSQGNTHTLSVYFPVFRKEQLSVSFRSLFSWQSLWRPDWPMQMRVTFRWPLPLPLNCWDHKQTLSIPSTNKFFPLLQCSFLMAILSFLNFLIFESCTSCALFHEGRNVFIQPDNFQSAAY